MIIYKSEHTDPYFNLATEEYFLRKTDEDVFMLYINEPSVIVGKHQNAVAEVNIPYVFEHQIKVVRRLSGGGTVYHDFGNLNYCFIQKGTEGHLVDFKKHSQPIIEVLNQMGVDAYLRGKSDLVIDDLKFSGNAEHVYRNKVLHHGTLLFNSRLNELNEVLKADWLKFTDKAVRSNRSKVTNILPFLFPPRSIEEFEQKIIEKVTSQNPLNQPYLLSVTDNGSIEKLVREKYSSWEWNFGYSPRYKFNRILSINQGKLSVQLTVEKGLIQDAEIYFSPEGFYDFELLKKQMINKRHHYHEIKEHLARWKSFDCLVPFTVDELLPAFF